MRIRGGGCVSRFRRVMVSTTVRMLAMLLGGFLFALFPETKMKNIILIDDNPSPLFLQLWAHLFFSLFFFNYSLQLT